MSSELLLVHTNDTHGRLGKPELPVAARLECVLREHPGAIYLDAGDTVSAGNLGVRPGGEPALTVLSDLGCRAMCLGNRETHPRKEIFPHKVDRARFPLLCANIGAGPGVLLPTVPSVVLDAGGVRVGIVGLTVPMFTHRKWSGLLSDYLFEHPLPAARREIAALRPRVDVLIALTHIGHQEDLALARACPELDLVIGGHSHTDLHAPAWVGEVPVVQAYAWGYYCGVARLALRGGHPRLTTWERRPLRDDAPPATPA